MRIAMISTRSELCESEQAENHSRFRWKAENLGDWCNGSALARQAKSNSSILLSPTNELINGKEK